MEVQKKVSNFEQLVHTVLVTLVLAWSTAGNSTVVTSIACNTAPRQSSCT